MKCPQAHQSVRKQPRTIGPSSATVIHAQPDPARRPGNDPHRRSIHIQVAGLDPARWETTASEPRTPAVTREGTRPVHDRHHPGGLVDMRAGFHDNPARNRPRGRAIPPGVAAEPSKLPMTSPSAGRTTATGAVLYCNPAADTQDRSPRTTHSNTARLVGLGRLLNPTAVAVDRGCDRQRHRRCRCTYPPEWLGTATWAGTGRRGFAPESAGRPGGDRCGRWSWLFQLFTSGGQEDGAQALGEFGLGGDQRGEPVELAALGEFLFGVDDGLQRGLVGVQGTLPGGAGGLDGLLVELADLFHAGLDRAFGLRGGGLDRVSGLRGDRVGGFQEIGGVLSGPLVRGAHGGFSLGSMWGWGVRGGDSAAAMGKGSAPGPGPADHGWRTSAHLGVLFLHRTTAAAVAGVSQRRDHPAYIGIT